MKQSRQINRISRLGGSLSYYRIPTIILRGSICASVAGSTQQMALLHRRTMGAAASFLLARLSSFLTQSLMIYAAGKSKSKLLRLKLNKRPRSRIARPTVDWSRSKWRWTLMLVQLIFSRHSRTIKKLKPILSWLKFHWVGLNRALHQLVYLLSTTCLNILHSLVARPINY